MSGDNPIENSTFSNPLLQFRFNQIRGALSKIRLGAHGKDALTRILTASELPIESDKFFKFERAYKPKKKMQGRHGESKNHSNRVIAERGFSIPGLNRFIFIVVFPYESHQAATDAFNYFPVTIRRRYAHNESTQITESDLRLPSVPDARLVKTLTTDMGHELRILSFAIVLSDELLFLEFHCSVTSEWNINDCEKIIRLQIDKLERVRNGSDGN
jgi:hypothetical protein